MKKVSYDVALLFTNMLLCGTVDFILDKLYAWNNINFFSEKSKKLSNKLCKYCIFLAESKLIKQGDGCPMGDPVSVVLSNLFIVEMEFDVVKPLKRKLYKRYVNDIYSNRIKN